MSESNIVVVASGYFDPLHIGHLDYLKAAKDLGDRLIVIVNNDFQTGCKKGHSLMSAEDRILILSSIVFVDDVVLSFDNDFSVKKTLESLKPHIFAKGGNIIKEDLPEFDICKKNKIKIVDGLGEKIRSSREILEKWTK
jgi:D-beta-D-heptose 7-phosphate kinase/D-beta-D-heptose 1-phosphate adenosyltransferase